jgi:sugar lactone lactonase YvrE
MIHPNGHLPSRGVALGALALALLLWGCGSAPAPAPRLSGVFYPPAPELPRIQYLTAFNGRKDVESQSQFNKFVVGEQVDVKLDKPYGVAIRDGKIYVCDTNSTVVVFDLAKKSFHILDGANGPGRLLAPVNISIEADGTKYVADPARGQVVAFGADDQFVRAYGEPGKWRPVDAVAYGDRLYVVDGSNAAVRVYDKASGELLKVIGDKGEESERLSRPTNVVFDGEGNLYVSDIGRFQVLVYDRDGHYRRSVGKAGDNLGHFARPKGLAIDRENHLFAVDASFANVQMFDPSGQLLLFFGAPGQDPGQLQLPAKVVIDYDNLKYFQQYVSPGFDVQYLVLVTSQFGPRLVNVFAYGRQRGQKYPTDAELHQQIEEMRKKERERLQKEGAPATPPPAAEPSPTPQEPPSANPG